MATVRNLKIKTSTCKRWRKELILMTSSENVLAESRMMTPDCRKRLEAALADLKGNLAELEEVNQEGPEIEDACSSIMEVENLYQTI
ncbi:hypothetical protein Dsin_014996 [Dipteronia sinensis]|uniref:Tubulin-specific chaperone A n=1 Tax=Dipteronia sinensis TaxID=43782 RepID=A0AAE0AN04_9ROSI|nr:hypothetical protein Dsin_014996 [Dipteronia sinensis]